MEEIDTPKFPSGRIMVLGHNFDSEKNYRISLNRKKENVSRNPTWKNLIGLLKEVGIAPEDVFFTNFFMGLITSDGNTGRFPGADDAAFVRRCRELFLQQVAIQRPAIILVLGIHVPSLISDLSQQLRPWANAKSFSQLDPDFGIVKHVRFDGIDHSTTVVALSHPSYRLLNVKHRRYGTHEGPAAELNLLRDALSSAH